MCVVVVVVFVVLLLLCCYVLSPETVNRILIISLKQVRINTKMYMCVAVMNGKKQIIMDPSNAGVAMVTEVCCYNGMESQCSLSMVSVLYVMFI